MSRRVLRGSRQHERRLGREGPQSCIEVDQIGEGLAGRSIGAQEFVEQTHVLGGRHAVHVVPVHKFPRVISIAVNG